MAFMGKREGLFGNGLFTVPFDQFLAVTKEKPFAILKVVSCDINGDLPAYKGFHLAEIPVFWAWRITYPPGRQFIRRMGD